MGDSCLHHHTEATRHVNIDGACLYLQAGRNEEGGAAAFSWELGVVPQ